MNAFPASSQGKAATKAVLLSVCLFAAYFGATIILHDVLCHEHMHELSSPLHFSFYGLGVFQDAILPFELGPLPYLTPKNEPGLLAGHISGIDHPPDLRA